MVLGTIKLAYPNGWKATNEKQQAELWATLFVDVDRIQVEQAVREYLLEPHEFPPTPGQINEIIKRNTVAIPEHQPVQMAWLQVKRALRNCNYSSEAEYARLPVISQRVVGYHEELKRMAMLSDEQLTFEGNSFRRRYEEILASPWELEEVHKMELSQSEARQLRQGDTHMTEKEATEYYLTAKERTWELSSPTEEELAAVSDFGSTEMKRLAAEYGYRPGSPELRLVVGKK